MGHQVGASAVLLPLSMHTSLRYMWNGATPRVHGWPFYRLTIDADGFELHPTLKGRLPPIFDKWPTYSVRWDEVERVERTQNGIRLFFADRQSPIVAATLNRRKLTCMLIAVEECVSNRFDPTIRPSTWNTA